MHSNSSSLWENLDEKELAAIFQEVKSVYESNKIHKGKSSKSINKFLLCYARSYKCFRWQLIDLEYLSKHDADYRVKQELTEN